MHDFISEDLSGSRFEDVRLNRARFRGVDLTDARFRLADMTGVVIRGALLVNVDISGLAENLRVNGVDVVPLVDAELNRRYPDRAKMRPAGADGFRDAWDALERLWAQTVDRARGLSPELLDARPSLDEVLALREDRMATVRRVLADLNDERLGEMTEPVTEPGYPPPESYAVRRCLQAILSEEWEHRLYSERDLDALTAHG